MHDRRRERQTTGGGGIFLYRTLTTLFAAPVVEALNYPATMTDAPNPGYPPQRTRRRRAGPTTHEITFMIIIVVFTTMSIALNSLHHEDVARTGGNGMTHHPILRRWRRPHLEKSFQEDKKKAAARAHPKKTAKHDAVLTFPKKTGEHSLGDLNCAAFGGPDNEIAAKEMMYWSDIPSDADYVSPFKRNNDSKGGSTQYMTFEPDGGGWNNIRMAMETVVVMAHAMGRTLVMPPAQGMYLLKKDRNKQQTDFSFADFFHLESLSKEHAGLDIITTEEFLTKVAMSGQLRNKTTGKVAFPPSNRTNWDGQDLKPYKEYMRDVIYTPLWSPSDCLAAFPASGEPHDVEDLHNMHAAIKKEGRFDFDQYLDKPTPVDAQPIDRMRETHAGRGNLCIYDENMQKEPVLHFMCYHKMRVRLLTHYYAFLFFEDWKQSLWEHRFVRDHLRYLDEMQCAAARVVTEIRNIAKREMNDNPDGAFDTFHIRRGDFQYKETRLEADVLYANSKDYIPEGSVLYIATDERKKEFFNIFKEHYKVYFLDDFTHLFKGLNTNYFGMLDQLIASRGRTFVGTFHSTFTGYINRMRGYHAEKDKLEGYELGQIQSYFFTPDKQKEVMRKYRPVRRPYFSREFPIAWRDIDKGIGEL